MPIFIRQQYGFLGQRVDCGDVNGDGADDLVIGSGQGTVVSQPVNAGVHFTIRGVNYLVKRCSRC